METEYHIIEVRRPEPRTDPGPTKTEAFCHKTIVLAAMCTPALTLICYYLAGKCRWTYPQSQMEVDDPSFYDDDWDNDIYNPYITLWEFCSETECRSLEKEPSWSEYASEIRGQRFLVIFGLMVFVGILVEGYVSSYEDRCPSSGRLFLPLCLWTLAYTTLGLIHKLNSMIASKSPYSGGFSEACHGAWIAALIFPQPFLLAILYMGCERRYG